MGKPLIMHAIDSVPSEVDEIIIPISYKREVMEEYLEQRDLREKVTLVDEPEPLGTGGAVKNVEQYIDGDFLVLNGDVIASIDLEEFVKFHRGKKGIASISLWEVDDPSPFGVALLDHEDRITDFQEKPNREDVRSNWINAGAYALKHEVLDYIGPGFVSMEREVFPRLLEKGMYGMKFDGYWIDCGTRENLISAHMKLMEGGSEVAQGIVADGSEMTEPVIIRESAVVAGAKVGPYAYVSSRAVVGLQSSIERSVLFEDVRIGTRCRIRDSIVDKGVTIPDGTEVISQIVSRANADNNESEPGSS